MKDRRFPCLALLVALILVPACGGGGTSAPLVFNTEAALALMELLSPRPDVEVQQEFEANTIIAPTGVLVAHQNLSVPPKIPPFLLTEISHLGVLEQFLTNAQLRNLFGGSEVQQGSPLNPTFPTGVGQQGAFTVEANKSELLSEGDFYYFFFNTKAPLPLPSMGVDPKLLFQFAFVMDRDGAADNNFSTTDNDFFNGTDRWYELTYSLGGGWRLFVWDWDDDAGEKVEITSAARAIFGLNALVLVVPASEFTLSRPGYRVTTFAHDGDFGIPAPHSWSGDLFPTVAQGLHPFPVPGG